MKKWLFLAVVIIGLLITSAYIFFPKELVSSNITQFNCNIHSVNRYLMNEDNWSKWWPGTIEQNNITGKKIFKYNGYEYLITEKKYNALNVQATNDKLSLSSTILFVAVSIDSVNIEWTCAMEATNNPLNRIRNYQEAKKVNRNLSDIMKSMRMFLNDPDKVYGIHINRTTVTDSVMVTTNFSTDTFPSNEKIYSYLDKITTYLTAQHAKQTNPPMFHVKKDGDVFNVMLAIPINKTIQGNTTYPIKWMVLKNILEAKVIGGTYTANHALQQLGMYMSDYQIPSPAIPFQSFVTNRLEEPDTSKWVTKIYYPIF